MPFPEGRSDQAAALQESMRTGEPVRSPSTVLQAQAIRDAVLGCTNRGEPADPCGLVVIDATISGHLDLSFFTISLPLHFADCRFEDQLLARDANITALTITNTEFRTQRTAIGARGLTAKGNVVFAGLKAMARGTDDTVDLSGASVGGDFIVTAAHLSSEIGTTMNASGISIGGLAYFKDVTAQSVCDGTALSLQDATISGRLILGDVCVKSGSGLALGADCLNVGGNTTFDDLVAQTASGSDTFRMVGARIGGTLSLDGARITNAPGDVRGVSRIACGNALNADGIEVRGDASFAMGLLARTSGLDSSAIRLVGAKIAGKLLIEDARLRAKYGTALYAAHLTIGGSASLKNLRASGAVCAVQLGRSRIGAHLILDAARLASRSGSALAADGINVGGQATFANDFLASTNSHSDTWPAVALGGARIGGQLDLSDARLNNKTGTTLFADGITVEADALLDDLRASSGFEHPAVRLVGARIRGKLDCRAFDVGPCVSALNVMYAEVGTLRLNDAYGPTDSRWLSLDGLTYKGHCQLEPPNWPM
jgi:hypothetical protein